ncbi:unnamed protein product [Auanema sp. JU1783]|nr:unnamed protein product [Auanema sp. JU1783]
MDYGNGNYPPIPYFNTGVYPGYDMNNPPIYFPQHPSNLLRDPFRSNSPFAQEQAPYPIEQDQGRWNFPHDYQNLPMRPYRQVVSVTNPEQDDLSVERSYTPTFQGSGPPLFPDETHDEMRRAVAFAMTAEQFDLDEKLQLLLNQLNLLSGDMKECMQELTAYPDKLNDPTRTFPVKPSPNSVKAPIVGDDPRRVIVNTSNKLIKVPKVVNASEECETEPQSNDILVVDSSKQSVRSLTDWVPLANGKKRKVNVVLNESNESVSPQSKKKTEAGSKIGSSSVLDEQRDVKDEVQWYEQTLVKPIPIKIEETDDALNCDTYSTIDLTNIQSDSGTVIIDDSSDTRATSFDMDIEPISRVESCQASPSDAALEKSAELKSLESAKNEVCGLFYPYNSS